jgi:hypothetical protein
MTRLTKTGVTPVDAIQTSTDKQSRGVVFELFSGSGRISQRLRKDGFECYTFDYDEKCHPDCCVDLSRKSISDLERMVGRKADFIWLSPDCTTYSLAQHGIHRDSSLKPKDAYAKTCDRYNERFAEELSKSDVPYILENPRGFYRKMPFADRHLYRFTTSYGSYGTPYCKFEDLFSNFPLQSYFKPVESYKGKVHLDRVPYDTLKRSYIPDGFIDDLAVAVRDMVTERRSDKVKVRR